MPPLLVVMEQCEARYRGIEQVSVCAARGVQHVPLP